MSISLRWDNNERTVIRLDFDGRWTAAQFDRALDHALTLIRGLDHTIYALGVIHSATPHDDPALAVNSVDGWPANLGGLIFVNATPALHASIDTLHRITTNGSVAAAPALIFVETLEQAYEQITILHLQNELTSQTHH